MTTNEDDNVIQIVPDDDTINVSKEEYDKLKQSYEKDHNKYGNLTDEQIDQKIQNEIDTAILGWIQKIGYADVQVKQTQAEEEYRLMQTKYNTTRQTRAKHALKVYTADTTPLDDVLAALNEEANAAAERLKAQEDVQ